MLTFYIMYKTTLMRGIQGIKCHYIKLRLTLFDLERRKTLNPIVRSVWHLKNANKRICTLWAYFSSYLFLLEFEHTFQWSSLMLYRCPKDILLSQWWSTSSPSMSIFFLSLTFTLLLLLQQHTFSFSKYVSYNKCLPPQSLIKIFSEAPFGRSCSCYTILSCFIAQCTIFKLMDRQRR